MYNVEVRHRRACIGILIDPRMQRKGIATLALGLIAEYGRRQLGLHQLLAAAPADNIASIALFERAGYNKIATLPQYIAGEEEGEYQDAVVFHKILKTRPK